MSDMPLFTIFTPTYNRAHTLHRVFDSLRTQTLRDFEWLVIDDGSTDNTRELVAGWAASADFPIRYFRQDHAGKHIAHNLAVNEARGQFFTVLDSDDGCVPNTLERLAHHWDAIPAPKRASFCGVGGLAVDQRGEIVGDDFPSTPFDANMRERAYVYRIRGEKCVAMLTNVMRQFPFPEIRGTNFIPEGTVWLAMGKTHKIRWVNEVFRIYYSGDEDADGSTLSGRRNLHKNAPGRLHYYAWVLDNDLEYFFHSPAPFLKAALMLPIVVWLSRESLWEALTSLHSRPARLLVSLALPLAFVIYAGNKARRSRGVSR